MSLAFSRNNKNVELLDFLQAYGQELLRNQNKEIQAALTRRKVNLEKVIPLEESYQISLNIGKNINLKPIKKYLLQQIEAAAYFLRDFQIGVLGQATSIFQLYEIELYVDDFWKYDFQFEAGKLLIQVPYWQISSLSRYLKDQQLRQVWQKGKHLPQKSPTRKFWWLINPIGEFRSSLRTMMLLAIQKRLLGIDKLLTKFDIIDGNRRESLLDKKNLSHQAKFKEAAISFLKKSANENKLGVDLGLVLESQDEQVLSHLIEVFKENLTDPNQLEELLDVGSLSLQQAISQEQSQVDIKMFGFVNVGNYHRIDVELNLSTGYLKKYVEIIPRKADVKAVQFGFVNVYTIDDITVTPNLHSAMKIDWETAALEKAMQELGLLNGVAD